VEKRASETAFEYWGVLFFVYKLLLGEIKVSILVNLKRKVGSVGGVIIINRYNTGW
jgi:hypothetical protein